MALIEDRATELPKIPGAKVAIVQSRWYSEYTDLVVSKCSQVLIQAGAVLVEHTVVPGSLEIPLAARKILRSGKGFEALVAVGVVLKGETLHFEVVVNECARGLSQVSFEEDTPVINEVIPAMSLEQVIARCSDNFHNKGLEAARAAVETIGWRRSYR